jgi:hypothetical protein
MNLTGTRYVSHWNMVYTPLEHGMYLTGKRYVVFISMVTFLKLHGTVIQSFLKYSTEGLELNQNNKYFKCLDVDYTFIYNKNSHFFKY